MKTKPNIAALALAFASQPALAGAPLPQGVWTNTEDAYFAEEEARDQPEWMGIEVDEDGSWRAIDAYGTPQSDWSAAAIPGLNEREEGGWHINGSELRMARPFTCWMSVRKAQDKADGSADWSFQNKLRVFDQGGRVKVGGDGAPEAVIRLRNVTWAKGSSNAPALVLYVHQENPDRAVSYAWAAPGSERIGINLRWIQGSCTRDDEEMGASNSALVDAGEQWRKLYEAGDWTNLRTLYTDDAILMTQGQAKIEGADQIVTFLQRLPQAGASVSFKFEPEEALALYPLGFVTAKYRMDITFPGRDPVQVAGRSYLVYRWQDGSWRLWRDMDNLAPDATPEDFAR